jgi:peptide/nickel transport system substrate-binding protein
MRRLLSLFIVAVALLTLVPASVAQDEVVMVIGWEQEPDLLNPMVSMTFSTLLQQGFYGRDVWDWDSSREIFPIIVEEIPTFENGLARTLENGNTQVTYKLREGMLWSDGEPITAADCYFWHDIVMDRSLGNIVDRGEYPNVVESLEQIDDYTLELTYNVPWPDYLVKDYMVCPYPKHVFEPYLEADGTIDNAPYWRGEGVVGYGPYILSEWVLGDHITFEKNPYWDGEEPTVDRIIAKFIPETAQMLNALDTGEIDMAYQWPDNQVANYEELENVAVWAMPGVYGDAIWVNMRDPELYPTTGHSALLDVRVREAIIYAIDRPTIAEGLIGPGMEMAKSWYSSQFWPEDLPWREYNPDRANELLDEAGWIDSDDDGIRDKDGEALILRWYTTTREQRMDYQAIAQEYLAEVGIGTQLIAVPGSSVLFAAYAQRGIYATGDFDIALFALSTEALAPVASLDDFGCDGIGRPERTDGFNGVGFCNPEYDELEALVWSTVDPELRMEYHRQVEHLFFDAAFWHGLYLRPTWYALRSDRWNVETFQNMGTASANYFNKCEDWEPLQ